MEGMHVSSTEAQSPLPMAIPAEMAPRRELGPLSALMDRRVLILAAIAAIGLGLYLGWGWLTAIGVAPILLAAAPCLVMCAFGLCSMSKGADQCSKQPAKNEPTALPRQE